MMNDIAVLINDEASDKSCQASEALAKKLSLPKVTAIESKQFSFLLFYEGDILKLINSKADEMAPVWVDFCKGKSAYRQKHQGKGKLPLSRACGIKQNQRPLIIDATAGLGQDAFVLAGLGCQVLCIEQNPILASLLEDGLARAMQGDQRLKNIVSNIQLIQDLSETVLTNKEADVIYLDPMYPHHQNKKQAKVNKGMQLFRVFPGTSSDEASLLKSALSSATERVVVKRPDWASPMAEQKPTYQVPGKNHRYDVYQIKAQQES